MFVQSQLLLTYSKVPMATFTAFHLCASDTTDLDLVEIFISSMISLYFFCHRLLECLSGSCRSVVTLMVLTMTEMWGGTGQRMSRGTPPVPQ